jgi:large subunit ribosomal protein L25
MTYTLNVERIVAGLDMTGKIKAVCYGAKFPSTPIALNLKDFTKLYKDAGESSVITLKGLDSDQDVLIHDIQRNVVKGTIHHADLYVVEKGKKIHVHVPVLFTGVSNAVKALNADLVKVLHEIEVEAEAKDLPHEIEVDLSKLVEVEDQILVSDLPEIKGVRFVTGADEVIVLAGKHKEEVEEEVATEIDMAAIEVSDQKGKKDEDAAEEPAA